MSPAPASASVEYARRHGEDFVLALEELLSIPSVSTLPEHRPDMDRAASWLRDHVESSGIRSEIIRGSGHPLIYGEWQQAHGKPTILCYGHYDVQPVDPIELWDTPPFRPHRRDGNIYARGASDDKGQTMTFLCAAQSILKTEGALPINLIFLLEGEEEAGGAAIQAFVEERADRLRADVVQVADTGMFGQGIPTIEVGLRGIVYTEITARGASHDLHSGLYGGVAPNPFIALAHVIAGLKDARGCITIPGFYDDVRLPDEEVLASWRRLPMDEESLRRDELGVSALVGEEGYSALERMWSRPTLDVHGIPGGFTGEGSKTVIPARAGAKISMRLVPDQRPENIFEMFRCRVAELTAPGVEIDVKLVGGAEPVLMSSENPFMDAARAALEETFGRPAVLGRSGGSIPIVGIFKTRLGLDSILMGWGLPDDNLHAPNEKLCLDNFQKGVEATIRFWHLVGDMR